MGQDNCKPQPGDLIEIDRPRHQHWALYVGDGYVINLTPVDKQDLKLGVRSVPLFIRKVKKQRLKEVVKNHKWCVNNKYDHSYTSLPVKEIIQRAESCNGRKLKYRGFGSNCEHFVTKLRYGDKLRAFVGSGLQILDMTEEKDSPNPGDLIKIKRGPYDHWALYVGDGYVIHMIPLGEAAPSVSASSGSIFRRKARVKKELLKVAGNNDWAVKNKCDGYRTPLPVEEIIWRAECCIGKELPYDVLGRCSEDFVINLHYGGEAKAALQDINSISSIVTAGIGITSLIAAAGIPVVGLPLVACVPFVAAGGGGLLASIGFTSSDIAHSVSSSKFEKAGRDILEQSCC